ncbi:hypothetical protein BDA99DRAFT_448245 [Phascolomyces articulosus]|uniref:MABP domain-containing protein n=1 Tax=Phascolomyces articulosus TaxID=60185 RepID=A0AAD5P798_9FUNG|nr:hypothetical protein BDA99DRAFT_448245 [Phascolomyces articulosus]
MRIPVDLNAGTQLSKEVYLDLKDDPASDPITDIKIVKTTDDQSFQNDSAWIRLDGNLNEGGSDDTALALYYTKDTTISRNAITSIIVKTGAHPVVSADYLRIPVNLNHGVDPITAISAKSCLTDDCYMDGWHRVEKDVNEGVVVGTRVYIFYQRERGKPPVTDVVIILNDQSIPEGYHKVDVDLNQLTIRGASIHLWYQVKENPKDEDFENAIQDLAIEYGHPSIVPFGWTKIPVDLNSEKDGKGGFGEPTFLFYRRDYQGKLYPFIILLKKLSTV